MNRLIEFTGPNNTGETEVQIGKAHAYPAIDEIAVDFTHSVYTARFVLTREDALALIASMAQALQRL